MSSFFNSKYLRSSMKYGVLGAAFSIIMFFVFIMMGNIPMVSARLFDFVLLPVFIFLAVKEFKDYQNAGELRFWQGMSVGFVVYFTLGIISGVFLYIYLSTFGSEIFADFVSNEIDKIIQNKDMIVDQMGETTYEDVLRSMQQSKVIHVAFDDLIKKSFVGLFISPVISLFMRTNMK